MGIDDLPQLGRQFEPGSSAGRPSQRADRRAQEGGVGAARAVTGHHADQAVVIGDCEHELLEQPRLAGASRPRDHGQAKGVKGDLEALTVRLPVRAGAGGRLFGAVTAADIVDGVARAGGPQVDKRRIEIGQPIKTVGTHQVTVRVHPEVTASVSVEVFPEA